MSVPPDLGSRSNSSLKLEQKQAYKYLDQAEHCIYEKPAAYTTPPALAADEALRDPPIHEAFTTVDIKANIITRLSDTDPRKIMIIYSETIHPWFSIFSQSSFCGQHPATWDAASVDFALLCFAIVLLNCAPQQLQGAYTLHSTHRSMYLMSKTWITLLEGAGWNSIDFVKARLLITLFEVSHGFNIAAYLSIANAARAADALVVFQRQEVSQSLAEQDREEYRIIWWGIAILDRYIATENGKWPPVTRGRPIPPDSPIPNPLHLQEHSSTAFSRLFEASILLDNVHTALHQPTSQVSFNIEEVTMITVLNDPRALILAFDNGSKATCSGASISSISQATAALDTLIDDIVERVAGLNRGNLEPEESSIPFFVLFLVYKAAAITTGRLQNGIESEANLQRLKVLRNALIVTAQRWLAGEHYLNLLDEDTAPRILKAVRS
ncbi:hypothetical protein V502_05375 [Pseudogymnoascus sp. VKM F-4520 (FW-2644)]|nr:hypothetical protein V502_05375 [Pseudogymnoascus sp. VKM F-4520 (FW-2644)]